MNDAEPDASELRHALSIDVDREWRREFRRAVFGSSGRVIGIHFGFFQEDRLSNHAAPIGRGLALLRQAGWKPVINPGKKTGD